MSNITVKINKRNLNALVRRESFRFSGGMFIPYAFIAVEFDTEKDNTARFYMSVLASSNSWTNYPGIKVWNNNNDDWTKAQVIDLVERNIDDILNDLSNYYPEVNFELVNFD
jgi:hypothetical protein